MPDHTRAPWAQEPMPPTYPVDEEALVYALWEREGAFRPRPAQRQGTREDPARFSVVMPPPNVTGVLHSGHAMDNQIPDVLVRFHRMRGDETVWVPGMDHAGIATHARVEAILKAEGTSRAQVGREAFLERAWAFARANRDTIRRQLRLLGVSADWDREAFTLDEPRAQAVREAFVRLYEQGYIYRARAIIQWCPGCQTALSDVEVERVETPGELWLFAYPLWPPDRADHLPEEVVVATTRPETLFGDVAVAVHPHDPRYRDLVGRHLVHPLTGRVLPIVADEAVDPEFGTGAVKITPDHDPVDFEVAGRHRLPGVRALDENGRITAAGGDLAGLDRWEARRQVVERMARQGRLRATQPHVSWVGHCSRCDTVVEPLASPQWFVRMRPLAQPVVRALERGELRLHPEHFTQVLLNWIDNLRDWTVSRQLWWGHPIPAWHSACGAVVVARQQPLRCPVCGETDLRPDPDVLDTWFSSGLWPFSVFGWPQRTPELERYYPTSVLCTGYDILFFWVFRMAALGYHFLGRMPFRDVLLHGLLRDEQGRKVSKSLGNGIDVAQVISAYGSDALRYAMTYGVTPGNDIRYREDRTLQGRNLANKIWNAVRFALPYLKEGAGSAPVVGMWTDLRDRWVRSRLEKARQRVEALLLDLEVGEALRVAQEAFWGEVCDWYLEMTKPRLRGEEGPQAQAQAVKCLDVVMELSLRLLHPFAPFVTENAWQRLPGRQGTLAQTAWPQDPQAVDEEAERALGPLMEAVRRLRNLRREWGMAPTQPLEVSWASEDPLAAMAVEQLEGVLRRLGHVSGVHRLPAGASRPPACVTESLEGATLFVHVGGAVDLEEEVKRLEAEAREKEEELGRLTARLGHPGFAAKAPPTVVEETRRRQEEAAARLRVLKRRLEDLREALSQLGGSSRRG